MVSVKIINGHKCYLCEECHIVYSSRKLTCECEIWCKKHKSCNLETIKYALNLGGSTK